MSIAHGSELLTEKQAAELMALSVKTLQGWRFTGKGPRFIKVGTKSVRYQVADILGWIDLQRRQSTSDPGTNAERDCNLLSPWGDK